MGGVAPAGIPPPAAAGAPAPAAFDDGAVSPPAGAAAAGALAGFSGAASGVVGVCGTAGAEVIGGIAPAAPDPIDRPLPNCVPRDAGDMPALEGPYNAAGFTLPRGPVKPFPNIPCNPPMPPPRPLSGELPLPPPEDGIEGIGGIFGWLVMLGAPLIAGVGSASIGPPTFGAVRAFFGGVPFALSVGRASSARPAVVAAFFAPDSASCGSP